MRDDHLVISLKQQQRKEPEPPAARPLPPSRPKRKRSRGPALLVTALFVVGAAGTAAWYFEQGHAASASQVAAVTAATERAHQQAPITTTDDVVTAVGKLIDLPQGETPTVATVTDLSKLRNEPFFAHATAGDIVLMYTAAREAYLYDPVRNKLVEVGPITTDGASTTARTSAQ